MRSQPKVTEQDAAHHEKMVLGAMLIDDSNIRQAVRSMTSAFFRQVKHRFIFEAIEKLHRGFGTVNMLTVCNVLTARKQLAICGGAVYLAELTGYVKDKAQAHHDAAIRAGVNQAGGKV